MAEANALQDQVTIQARASRPFTVPDYDQASFTSTRQALLQLARGLPGFERAFGAGSRSIRSAT